MHKSLSNTDSQGWVPWERFTVAQGEADMLVPVAATTASGRLVIAFQHRVKEGNTISVTSSGPQAVKWSPLTTIVQAARDRELVPTGMGRLVSGRLVLTAASLRVTAGQIKPVPDRPANIRRFSVKGFRLKATPHIYCSDDEGNTWKEGKIEGNGQLLALVPCGHPIEADGFVWLLAYGPVSEDEMDRELSSLGLLQSEDGGLTWRYMFTIVRADVEQTLSYGPADLVRLTDGTRVAFIEVNDRSMGRGIEARIARSASRDGGKTWTAPVNTLVGPRPSVVLLRSGSVFCGTSADDGVHAAMSHDGGHRWSSLQHIHSAIHYSPGKRGGIWLTEPDEDTIFGVCHWMHSSKRGRTQVKGFFVRRKQADWPPGWPDRPYRAGRPADAVARWSRAEAKIITLAAKEANAGLAYPSLTQIKEGRWLAVGMGVPPETVSVVKGGKMPAYKDKGIEMRVFLMEAPQVDGPWRVISRVPVVQRYRGLWAGLSMLPSGAIQVNYITSEEGNVKPIRTPMPGAPRGFYWQDFRYDTLLRSSLGVCISNDGGETWVQEDAIDQTVRIEGIKPACAHIQWPKRFIHLKDGTLITTGSSWLTEGHWDKEVMSIALLRSRDGGASWEDGTFIARANLSARISWRGAALAVLPDGRWLALLYTTTPKWGRNKIDDFMPQWVSYSQDEGRSWSKPRAFVSGNEQSVSLLSDGTLFIGTRKYNQSFYWLSDDGGETFFLQETVYDGPELAAGRTDILGSPVAVILDENTIMTLADPPGPQVMSSGPVYVRYLRRETQE